MVGYSICGGTILRIIDTVYRRKSVRSFMDNEIEQDLLTRIKTRLEETELLYKDKEAKLKFIVSDYCKKSYYAPYYIGVYGQNTKEAKLNAGCVMEQLAIYLSAIGIGSCFQGKSMVFKETNAESKVLLISMAIGYPETGMYRDVDDVNRLKKEKICVYKETPNEEVAKLIELARIAPSSYNAQPWRFVVYSNKIHVFVKKRMLNHIGKFKYVNIGAMLGNIISGSEELWIDIVFKEKENIKSKEYGDNEYVISIYNKTADGKKI